MPTSNMQSSYLSSAHSATMPGFLLSFALRKRTLYNLPPGNDTAWAMFSQDTEFTGAENPGVKSFGCTHMRAGSWVSGPCKIKMSPGLELQHWVHGKGGSRGFAGCQLNNNKKPHKIQVQRDPASSEKVWKWRKIPEAPWGLRNRTHLPPIHTPHPHTTLWIT